MGEKPKVGFLFDLDGVIIDSEGEYTKIWAQINREFPTGIENLEYIIKGCTLSKILNDFYQDDEIRKSVSKRLHQLEELMKYDFLPYTEFFLKSLYNRNLPCVLVTSSDNKKLNHLWDEIPDLKNYFNFIISGDMVTSSKPSPEGYLLAAEKINVNPENCVVFEDSLQGVQAGKNSGAYVVGIEGTLSKEILAPFSHIIINNFNEINLDHLIQILTQR